MKTAKEVRLAVQNIIELPEPRFGNFGDRSMNWLEQLAKAPDDSQWPPVLLPETGQTDRASVIISTARRFEGLTEKKQNSLWDNPSTPGADAAAGELRQALLDTGWQLTWPYCIAFAEVCWRVAYAGHPQLAELQRLITPSVMETFTNFNKLGLVTNKPLPGSIFLKQHGNKWQGHAGIVVASKAGNVLTIEGNTSAQAGTPEAEREGDGVFAKHWPLNFTKRESGLWLRGFINPF